MSEHERRPAVGADGVPDADGGGLVPDVADRARRRLHLVVLAALAATAGWVDAAVYSVIAPTFVANQSGNVVLLGMSAGEARWLDTAAAAVSIAGFALGLALSAAYRDRRRAAGEATSALVVVGAEVVALVALAALAQLVPDRTVGIDGRVLAAMAVGAMAMGAQTTVLRRVWGVQVSTTYTSGEVARLSEVEAAAAVGAPSDDGSGDRRAMALVLLTGVCAYAAGAAGAAFMGGHLRPFVVPPVVLAVIAVVLRLDQGRSGVLPGPTGRLSRRRSP